MVLVVTMKQALDVLRINDGGLLWGLSMAEGLLLWLWPGQLPNCGIDISFHLKIGNKQRPFVTKYENSMVFNKRVLSYVNSVL